MSRRISIPLPRRIPIYAPRLVDGTIVEQEFNVRQLDKAAIKRIFVQNPDATVHPPCIDALRQADLITIGPGSLFTTVIACLAFKDIAQAIRDSSAVKVYICNTTTQPGQTDGYTLSDHVQQVISYLGIGVLDYVVLNSSTPSAELMELYAREQVDVLLPTTHEVHKYSDDECDAGVGGCGGYAIGQARALAEAGYHPPQSGIDRGKVGGVDGGALSPCERVTGARSRYAAHCYQLRCLFCRTFYPRLLCV